MSEVILKVENLSKQYRLGTVGTGTISHDLNRWWHRIRGKEDPYLKIGDTNDRTKKGDQIMPGPCVILILKSNVARFWVL